MSGKTISFRMKLPSFSVRLVKPPQVNLVVNPLVLVLFAALLLYASFENTRLEAARLREDLGRSAPFAEELSANVTSLAARTVPPASPAPTAAAQALSGDSDELVKSLSASVNGFGAKVAEANSLDRYYSSKLQTTNAMRIAAANAAQKPYSDNADQCLKLSDSEAGREKNMTNCRNAKSIYYWARDSVKFEPAYELGYMKGEVQLPTETLSSPAGGSADHAVLLASLLRSRGIEARLVAIPAADYMLVAARITGLADTYPDSVSWKTATSTGIRQPPYDYFGDKKDLVLLDAECKVCAFGRLRDEHRTMDMKMLAYYNATGNN